MAAVVVSGGRVVVGAAAEGVLETLLLHATHGGRHATELLAETAHGTEGHATHLLEATELLLAEHATHLLVAAADDDLTDGAGLHDGDLADAADGTRLHNFTDDLAGHVDLLDALHDGAGNVNTLLDALDDDGAGDLNLDLLLDDGAGDLDLDLLDDLGALDVLLHDTLNNGAGNLDALNVLADGAGNLDLLVTVVNGAGDNLLNGADGAGDNLADDALLNGAGDDLSADLGSTLNNALADLAGHADNNVLKTSGLLNDTLLLAIADLLLLLEATADERLLASERRVAETGVVEGHY